MQAPSRKIPTIGDLLNGMAPEAKPLLEPILNVLLQGFHPKILAAWVELLRGLDPKDQLNLITWLHEPGVERPSATSFEEYCHPIQRPWQSQVAQYGSS